MGSSSSAERTALRDFLVSRRARISPQQAGLAAAGGNRRVPGLRREEVAALAGLSVEYYIRLERGSASGISDSVLDAVVGVLQLDEAERAHLYDLVRSADAATRARRRPPVQQVRQGVRQLLDATPDIPVLVQNGRLDLLAANALARALYVHVVDAGVDAVGPTRMPNFARYIFLDLRARDFFPDWDRAAADAVAMLRAEAGRSPEDRVLRELVGELATRSERFASLWAAQNVRWHATGTKRFRHPVAGEMLLAYEAMALSDPGQTLITFTAEPGSPSRQALAFLASWSADQPRVGRTLSS